MATERTILGIDPGTTIMGYGLIKGSTHPELITMGFLSFEGISDPFTKLQKIFEKTSALIKEYKASQLAIEAPFYGKNIQSMLKLGRAQGVAIAAGLSIGIPVTEYLPRKIKMAVTGNGNASKEQIAGFLQLLFHFEEMPKHFDATDALAVAVCHFYQNSVGAGEKKISSWKEFIRENPGKINR